MNTEDNKQTKKLKVAINRDLSYEEIGNLIVSDPIKRNEELKEAIRFIDSIDGNASIFLDADWGSGKTVFVKQLEMIFWQLNSEKDDINLKNKDEVIEIINNDFAKEVGQNYLPVYYSAWANDCYDDPLATIVSEIAIKTSNKFKEGWTVDVADILCNSVDAITSLVGIPSKISEVKNNIKKNDFFALYKSKKKLNEKVKKYINDVSKLTNSKILLIVDELDRCKPTFALDLLESIKTLFNNEKIIVLYSLNTSELSKTVSTFYGQGLDGDRYLQRFYDFNIPLNKINANIYTTKLFDIGKETNHLLYVVSQNFSNIYNLSLRELNIYNTQIEDLKNIQVKDCFNTRTFEMLKCVVIPVIMGIKIINKNDYKKISKYYDSNTLKEYIFECKDALDIIISKYKNHYKFDDKAKNYLLDFLNKFSQDTIDILYKINSNNDYYLKNELNFLNVNVDIKKIVSKYA